MPEKIDSIGTYTGTIAESGVSVSKNGIPQWIARLTATKKFVESASEIEHFQKQGLLADGQPAYVDWSSFDQDIITYQSLYSFKTKVEICPDTETRNVEQLHLATGWSAPDFDSLGNGSLIGKEILFRVGEKKAYTDPATGKTYGGDGTLEVSWIDNKDAPPSRQLKSLASDDIKTLMGKVTGYGKTAAKPATAPARPAATAPKPAAPVASTPAPIAATASPQAASTSAPASPKPAPKRKAAAPAPAPAPAPAAALPAETTQADGWAIVNARKGQTEDQVIEEAWIAACGIVGENKDQDQFTGQDWADVVQKVLEKIAA